MQIFKSTVIDNPINTKVIQYLSEQKYSSDLEFLSGNDIYSLNKKNLRTHPDMIELLWNDHAKKFSEKCQMILFGTPTLINPVNGIIFGIAEGTYPPLLRLPQNQKSVFLAKGGKEILSDLDVFMLTQGDWVRIGYTVFLL